MVIDRATRKTEHTRFDKIDNYLRPGDLLVFNSSRTLPASMRGCECSESHDAQHPASEEEYFVSATAADKINLPSSVGAARSAKARLLSMCSVMTKLLPLTRPSDPASADEDEAMPNWTLDQSGD